MRERFTTEEWEAVKRLPFVAFGMVAGADGALQREEAERFVEELRATAFCREPLRRALTQDVLASAKVGIGWRRSGSPKLSHAVRKIRSPLIAGVVSPLPDPHVSDQRGAPLTRSTAKTCPQRLSTISSFQTTGVEWPVPHPAKSTRQARFPVRLSTASR